MTIPDTMNAVVLHGADDMQVERRPVPKPGTGEVVLKVEVASICGTDVKVLHRTLQGQPAGEFIMGHEYAGTVAALGSGVDEFQIGDRVAVEVHKGCERLRKLYQRLVHLVPKLRQSGERTSGEGPHLRWRLRRIHRQSYQHALPLARQSHI